MNGHSILGLWVAPKMFTIIVDTKLGKPQEYSILEVEEAVKRECSAVIVEIGV
jgi:hypothetical protein